MWVTADGYDHASAAGMGAKERLPLPYVFLVNLPLHQTGSKNLMVLKQAYLWLRIGGEAGTVPSRWGQAIFLPSAHQGKWMVLISFLCFVSYKQKKHLSKPSFCCSFTSCAHKPYVARWTGRVPPTFPTIYAERCPEAIYMLR